MSDETHMGLSVPYAEALALISRLYRALDAGDAELLLSSFTEDAVWHRPDGPRAGEAALRAIVVGRPADRKTLHIPSNLLLIEEGGELVAHYYLMVYGEAEGVAAHLNCCFDCSDALVRTAGGLRIREKRAKVRMKFA